MDKLRAFIESVGQLVEMWAIVYENFIRMGFNEKEATRQTEAFFRVTLTLFIPNVDTKDEE